MLISDIVTDNALDVMVLTETWHSCCSSDVPLRRAAPVSVSIINAPRPRHGDDDADVNHGGIALLHRDIFSSRIIAMHFHPTSFELLACYLNSAVGKFILVNVYRPSSHNITEAFFKDLTSLHEIISTYSSMTVLVGDFNIHVNDSHDVMALRFLDLIDAFGLVQHVTGPTHAHGHTLDLVITAPNYAPTDISTDPSNIISDHGFVTCQFAMALPAPTSQRRKIIRQLNSLHANVFNTAVHQSPVGVDATLFDGRSTSDLCELYNNELWHLLDVIAPPTVLTVTERTTSPWFDGECRECRKRTRALERRYRRSRLPEDCSAWSAALGEKRALYVAKE